jgi:hypothetical protein
VSSSWGRFGEGPSACKRRENQQGDDALIVYSQRVIQIERNYQARLWLADLHSYSTKMALYYHYGNVTNESVPHRICQSAQYQANQKRFIAKWGHLPVRNAVQAHRHYFEHPFNNPEYSLKDCPNC